MQQELPTYFPQSSPRCVLPAFFALGIIFLTLGSVIMQASDSVFHLTVRYDAQNSYQYLPEQSSTSTQQGLRRFSVNGTDHAQGSRARVFFSLSKPLEAPIYLYYGLTNYYQNYLDYHDGRSSLQLAGSPIDSQLRYKCEPFLTPGSVDGRSGATVDVDGATVQLKEFTYSPCGVTAWSMFNDTFTLYSVADPAFQLPPSSAMAVNMSQLALVCNGSDFTATGAPLSGRPNGCSKLGISWAADTTTRFKPAVYTERTWGSRFPHATTDPYLKNGWYAFEPGHSVPDPTDLDFHVWMRIAPTPSFRKLYRILNVSMPAGTYLMEIEEFYDASSLGSEKNFQLRVESWLGMPNHAIGIAYIAAGSLGIVLAVGFLAQQLGRIYYPRTFSSQELRPHYQFATDSEEMKEYVRLRRERLDERAARERSHST
jgi:hypothetical protein